MAPSRPPRMEMMAASTAPFTIRAKVKSRMAEIAFFRGICPELPLFATGGTDIEQEVESATYPRPRELIPHACRPRHRSYRSRPLCLAADCLGNPVLADRLQCREHAQPVRGGGSG